jgi:hypothetical protein
LTTMNRTRTSLTTFGSTSASPLFRHADSNLFLSFKSYGNTTWFIVTY